MTNINLNERADTIFYAKIKSGKYSHYTDEDLAALYVDCAMQAKAESVYSK